MANRDFNKIKRTIKDFSLNVGSGEGSNIVKVTELPEVGKEDTIYELTKTIEPFNWFGMAFWKLDNGGIYVQNYGYSVAVFPSFESLPVEYGNRDIIYVTLDTKKMYNFNDENLEYVEFIPSENFILSLVSDFTEENVTLLDGTVGEWEISRYGEEEGSGFSHIYIYLFQNNKQFVNNYTANTCKNFYEFKFINSPDELPEEPEESFVRWWDFETYSYKNCFKYAYVDQEGYEYFYEEGQWIKEEYAYLTFNTIQYGYPDDYFLEISGEPVIIVEKFAYEDGEWVNLSNLNENIRLKPVENIRFRITEEEQRRGVFVEFDDPNDYSGFNDYNVTYGVDINGRTVGEFQREEEIDVTDFKSLKYSDNNDVAVYITLHLSVEKEEEIYLNLPSPNQEGE